MSFSQQREAELQQLRSSKPVDDDDLAPLPQPLPDDFDQPPAPKKGTSRKHPAKQKTKETKDVSESEADGLHDSDSSSSSQQHEKPHHRKQSRAARLIDDEAEEERTEKGRSAKRGRASKKLVSHDQEKPDKSDQQEKPPKRRRK